MGFVLGSVENATEVVAKLLGQDRAWTELSNSLFDLDSGYSLTNDPHLDVHLKTVGQGVGKGWICWHLMKEPKNSRSSGMKSWLYLMEIDVE